MREITAYEDSAGRLHKTRRAAIDSDFIAKLQEAWGSMPDQRDRGDPVVIARIIVSDVYPTVRKQIAEALAWFEDQLAATTLTTGMGKS